MAMWCTQKAVTNFDRLKREALLLIEDTAELYVYRLRMGSVTQTGVAGCYSLDEYDRDMIKKHERTGKTKKTSAPDTCWRSVPRLVRCSSSTARRLPSITQSPTWWCRATKLYDFTAPTAHSTRSGALAER